MDKPIGFNARVIRTANTFRKCTPASVRAHIEKGVSVFEVVEHPNIPVDTVYIGYMFNFPQVGESILMAYTKKNGTVFRGSEYVLQTTPIIKIDGDNYHTENSVYNIVKLKESDANQTK